MKNSLMALVLITFLLLISSIASARIWLIRSDGSGDAPTIQAGIDSAQTNDEVVLEDGTYTGVGNRDVDFKGKTITVRSQSGNASACVIDCEWSGRGFYFHLAEGFGSVLNGVMVIRGSAVFGAGILCQSSSPTISNCIFFNNSGVQGGGMTCTMFAGPRITNCTFSRNSASFGSGVIIQQSSAPTLDNTIICFSTAGAAVFCDQSSIAILNCCNVYGNAAGDYTDCIAGQADVNGNFSADPEFCGILDSGHVFLQSDSPCAPGNHPRGDDCGLIGALPVNCGTTDTEQKSWGALKALYRD